MDHIIGVDLGGTAIKVGAVPVDGGTVLGMRSLPTDAHIGAKFVVDRIVSMILDVKRDATREGGFGEDAILGVGMGAPGPLDRETGTVVETPNLGWRNFPLRDLIVKGTGFEAELDNDANAATLGEWWRGAGRGVDHLVGVTLGTGIGGGLMLDGELYHGASDVAAEIGHMTIDSTGRKCGCGNYGCLEAYASGPAIASRAVDGLKAGAESMLPALVEGDLRAITAETVSDAIVAGDEYAGDVMRETARYLGTGLANLINVLNPEMIVVSGGVTRAGRHLFDPLRREVRKRAFRPAAEACRIVRTELGGMAGVIGAAAVFRVARLGPL
ncbi:ROK family protein [Candidatus Palauibacter sp.]|uniref:ROK family protein n=1 Tax=Candidatus Palauibacter sp. TaxID=3101350 RepID=UPI003B52C1A2